jgi:hypothetical protein
MSLQNSRIQLALVIFTMIPVSFTLLKCSKTTNPTASTALDFATEQGTSLYGFVGTCQLPGGNEATCLSELILGEHTRLHQSSLGYTTDRPIPDRVNITVSRTATENPAEEQLSLVSQNYFPATASSTHTFFEGVLNLAKGEVTDSKGRVSPLFPLAQELSEPITCVLGSLPSGDLKQIKVSDGAACGAAKKTALAMAETRGWKLQNTTIHRVITNEEKSQAVVTVSYSAPTELSQLLRAFVSLKKSGQVYVAQFNKAELLFGGELDAAAAVSDELNDICGDTFCAGDYDYREIEIQCGKEHCSFQALLTPYFLEDAPLNILDQDSDLNHMNGENSAVKWSFGSVEQKDQKAGRRVVCTLKKTTASDLFKPQPQELFYKAIVEDCIPALENALTSEAAKD